MNKNCRGIEGMTDVYWK